MERKKEEKNGKSESFSMEDMQQKNMMETIVLAPSFGCVFYPLDTAMQDAFLLQIRLLLIHFSYLKKGSSLSPLYDCFS